MVNGVSTAMSPVTEAATCAETFVSINSGRIKWIDSNEASDWALAELITWDRALTRNETADVLCQVASRYPRVTRSAGSAPSAHAPHTITERVCAVVYCVARVYARGHD